MTSSLFIWSALHRDRGGQCARSAQAVPADELHRVLSQRHHRMCSVTRSPEVYKAPRALYTSVVSSDQFKSVSRTIPRPPTHGQAEDQKELTGPHARSAAACPRGFEGAGAGPLAAPAAGAGAGAAAGRAATTGPAPRSPCPCSRSTRPASTRSRTSTWAAWAGLPATVLEAPSCEGRRRGIAWTAVEARMAFGPVAAGISPVPSSEASTGMCCGLHLGEHS